MKYLLFILCSFVLFSCDSHSAPSDNISFGQAWKYAWTLPGYYLPLIAVVLLSAVLGFFLKKDYEKQGGWTGVHIAILAAIVIGFAAALLAAPASIAANTTIEQAARGVYIR